MSNMFGGIYSPSAASSSARRSTALFASNSSYSALRRTVGDDTAPGLVAVGIAAKDQRADRDGLIHVAAPAEIAHRSAIKLSAHRFEFVDDFHGTHLGRTHQRARGKGRREQVEGILPGCQAALDAADDVHDVAVAFDHAIGIDAHRARDGHPPQIVAREIDQHHVLGVFLRIAQQFGLQRGIAAAHRRRAACDPAMGRNCAWPPWHFTSASGDEPTTVMSPSSQKNM